MTKQCQICGRKHTPKVTLDLAPPVVVCRRCLAHRLRLDRRLRRLYRQLATK